MKEFGYYLAKGDVKRQSKDSALALALVRSGLDRIRKALSEEQTKDNAKYILENAYEGLRELADARLALDGFKSYSHEASISFLEKFPSFGAGELEYFDRLRYLRNGIKYYGLLVSVGEAKESLAFAEKMKIKLKALVKSD